MEMLVGPDAGAVADEEARASCARVLPGTGDDALARVARILSRGGLAAVAAGPMEFGPRALGNRSILAPADDPALARYLNQALGRPQVMPLAPVVRARDLARVTADPAWSALREMTATVDARPGLASRFPVAVHADGTMRLQVATRRETPLLHRLLTLYGDHMDPPLLINTSLNLHTEPIVRTARRALELYRELPLDALILEDRVLLGRAP
jgi:carbamoyltransferase